MTRAVRECCPRRHEESGLATVWATAWILALLLVAEVGLVLGFAQARQHQVDSAADLVSLSAATRLQHGGNPCQSAARAAAANHVALTICRATRGDVVVGVRARLDLPFGLHPWVSASSRAGPL
ncbi:MAG: Rv3654c family TadE-like protein [Nocardioidaceae bacterium]